MSFREWCKVMVQAVIVLLVFTWLAHWLPQ